MRFSQEYARRLYAKTERLDARCKAYSEKIESQEKDIEFLKKCLYMALSNRAIVIGRDFEELEDPTFRFDENLEGDPILRANRK